MLSSIPRLIADVDRESQWTSSDLRLLVGNWMEALPQVHVGTIEGL